MRSLRDASCRLDLLRSFAQLVHCARRVGQCGSPQRQPFCAPPLPGRGRVCPRRAWCSSTSPSLALIVCRRGAASRSTLFALQWSCSREPSRRSSAHVWPMSGAVAPPPPGGTSVVAHGNHLSFGKSLHESQPVNPKHLVVVVVRGGGGERGCVCGGRRGGGREERVWVVGVGFGGVVVVVVRTVCTW